MHISDCYFLVPSHGPEMIEYYIEEPFQNQWFSDSDLHELWEELQGLIGRPESVSLRGELTRLELKINFPTIRQRAQVKYKL